MYLKIFHIISFMHMSLFISFMSYHRIPSCPTSSNFIKNKQLFFVPLASFVAGDETETAVVEDSSAFSTKEVLGYMWTVNLLKKHNRSVPKKLQSIVHQGKTVKGAICEDWVLGALVSPSSFRVSPIFWHDTVPFLLVC